MLGTKLSYMGCVNGENIWETNVLPFIHPETGEAVDEVRVNGSRIVSPEKAADIREECDKYIDPNVRYPIYPVVVPSKI